MSHDALRGRSILIVEDGDEYRENLGRSVPGPRYLQAHSGGEALGILRQEKVDLIYLDMRFDRTDRRLLFGDHEAICRQTGAPPEQAWRQLETNQGLFILEGFRREGFGELPVVLAYDFSFESRRAERLRSIHPSMRWIGDTAGPEEIREAMRRGIEKS